MKIVHFADLHLDAPFAWAGASGGAARRRRQALRDVLVRIVDLTREVRAEALFCGGDLYEHEHCTPDTAEFLRKTFAELAPVPVYLAAGNHDWYGPHSPYALVEWSHNVFVFSESHLMPVELSDGVTLWGAAHRAPTNTGNLLYDFHTEGCGIHLALFHGSERSWLMAQSGGKQPHAAFDTEEIGQSGIHHAFLGHYHRPKDGERHTVSTKLYSVRVCRGARSRTEGRSRHRQGDPGLVGDRTRVDGAATDCGRSCGDPLLPAGPW